MVLATIFVSLPFVVREVVPVLREIGIEQEEAASTLGASGAQTFWRITLPAIRWGVAYGVILTTARALGEFGAVAVVSGKIEGQTETMTLFVEQRFQAFDLTGAYAASVVLAAARDRRHRHHDPAGPSQGGVTDGHRRAQRQQVLQRLPGAGRRLAQRARRLADRAARPVGRRQVDAAAGHRGARGARPRRGPVLRRGGDARCPPRSAASASSSSTTPRSST